MKRKRYARMSGPGGAGTVRDVENTPASPANGTAVPFTLGRRELLTAQQAASLACAAEAGALAGELLDSGRADPADVPDLRLIEHAGRRAFHDLVEANVRLVAWCARKRMGNQTFLDFDDLVAIGMTGLVRAVHKWDHTRGLKFSTYAVNWVVSVQGRAIRVASGLSVSEHEQRQHIRRTREELTATLSRTPTAAELSAAVGLASHRIEHLESLAWHQALDAPLTAGSDTTHADLLADARSVGADPDAAALVSELLADLPERFQRVLRLHFGLDGPALEPAQIARECAVSAARAQRTLSLALDELRHHAAKRGG